MKLQELREKRTDDLRVLLAETQEKAFRMRCITEKLTPQKGVEIRALKRTCAQLHTVLRQRELESELPVRLAELDKELASKRPNVSHGLERKRVATLKCKKQRLVRVKRALDEMKKA